LQFATANAQAKIAKEYVFANAISRTGKKPRKLTNYIKNSGFGALTKSNL